MEKNRSKFTIIILLLITLVGILFRVFNISSFKIYPDSYQNLIVAENIRTYQSVVGFLGSQGMLYPDFFSWTRPIYALFINLCSLLTQNTTIAAQFVSLLAGIIAIPLAFLFIKNVFRSLTYALAGAFLLAFSFNHAVWSGFIMTETVGILFMLFFLWSLFRSIHSKTTYANPRDMITGLLLCVAVLARYEYIIMLLPILFLAITKSPQPFRYLTTIIGTFFLGLMVVGLILYPLGSTIGVIIDQSQNLLQRTGIILVLFLIMLISIHSLPQRYKHTILHLLPNIAISFLSIFTLYISLQVLPNIPLSFLRNDLSFIRNFVQHDILVSIFSLVGFALLLQNTKLRVFGYFALLSILFLGFIYHRINPDMERYLTHLLPFLLIPASYAFGKIIQYLGSSRLKWRIIFSFKYILSLLILLILVILQINTTSTGLRYLNDPSWYHIAYEEKVALQIKKYLTESCQTSNNKCKHLIIASFPEPYFYTLRNTTYSITNSYPYIYIPDSFDKSQVIIIEDMGMHDIFPSFTDFLEKNLQAYRIKQFRVNENYHYTNRSQKESHPVNLYMIRLEELKEKINKI